MTIMNVLSLFGGLGLFLFGMQLMGEALEKAAGTRLKKLLGMVTGNRFLAMLAGITITAVVQSSSATTVMVVGFVNAGLMSLTQAVGVIMAQTSAQRSRRCCCLCRLISPPSSRFWG